MLRQESLRSGKSTPEVGLTYPVARVFPGENRPYPQPDLLPPATEPCDPYLVSG